MRWPSVGDHFVLIQPSMHRCCERLLTPYLALDYLGRMAPSWQALLHETLSGKQNPMDPPADSTNQ